MLAQVLVRWALHGEEIDRAVTAPRFHLDGDQLRFEEPPAEETADDLVARGYAEISGAPSDFYFGSVQALEIGYETAEVTGSADPRRGADWRVDSPG